MRWALWMLAFAAIGCGARDSFVEVSLSSGRALAFDALEIAIANGGDQMAFSAANAGSIPPAQTFSIELGAERSGMVAITVVARDSAGIVAEGAAQATIVQGGVATTSIVLAPALADAGVFDQSNAIDQSVADLARDDRAIVDLALPDLRKIASFTPPRNSPTGGAGARDLVAGDFDGDGKIDLAVANQGQQNVGLLRGKGDGSFQAATTFAVGNAPTGIVAGDWNGDQRLDLAVANYGGNSYSVLLGDGMGGFQSLGATPAGNLPAAVAADDLDGDQKIDLAIVNLNAKTCGVYIGGGGGAFGAPKNFSVGMGPGAVRSGDWNRDGKRDLAVADQTSNDVSLLLNAGNGNFAAAVVIPSLGTAPGGLATGDLDGDGNPDLIVANASGPVTVFLGKGDGSFRPGAVFAAGMGPAAVALADFDGDGALDLAVANAAGGDLSLLLGNGNGTLQDARAFDLGGSGSYALVVADFDSDGKPDVATANLNSNNVSVLLNATN